MYLYSLVFACTEHYTGARFRLQCWRWVGRIPAKRVLRRLDYNNWSRRDLAWTCTTISLFVFFYCSVLVLWPLLIQMILLPAHQYEFFIFSESCDWWGWACRGHCDWSWSSQPRGSFLPHMLIDCFVEFLSMNDLWKIIYEKNCRMLVRVKLWLTTMATTRWLRVQ
jgi:hypothetical protein